MAAQGDGHFDESGRGAVFAQQAIKAGLKMVADLDWPELAGKALANLVGISR